MFRLLGVPEHTSIGVYVKPESRLAARALSSPRPPMAESSDIELVLDASEAGERLDKVLSARPLGFSRSVIQRWLESGRITVDGAPADKKARAKAGARVLISPEPPPRRELVPEDLPLDVLYEDEHLIVIDKAA